MEGNSAVSKFISQGDIDSAKEARENQWKEAYARLGQEPPPVTVEDTDTRSLAEKLAANKIAKQEEWEERSKLANQFRALEEDEVAFLDSVQEKHDAEQRQRQQIEGEEVKGYREAVAAHHTASKPRPPQPSAAIEPPKPKPAPRKEVKKTLKGVVVKKKAKSTTTKRKEPAEETVEPDAKRRKESDS